MLSNTKKNESSQSDDVIMGVCPMGGFYCFFTPKAPASKACGQEAQTTPARLVSKL